jgi:hypothetical protein
MTRMRASDVVLWLSLPGRSEIPPEYATIINPYRRHVRHAEGQPTAIFAISLDRAFFSKRRQKELSATFEKLAPYELTAEIALYHPSDRASCSVDLPPRIVDGLTALGARLTIVSYLSG